MNEVIAAIVILVVCWLLYAIFQERRYSRLRKKWRKIAQTHVVVALKRGNEPPDEIVARDIQNVDACSEQLAEEIAEDANNFQFIYWGRLRRNRQW